MGFVVNLVLDGRLVVVVGGGAVASRKIEDLLAADARVAVVAPRACERIRDLANAGRIRARWGAYESADLEDAFLVVAATDDEAVNARVSSDAQARGLLVNVVDRPALCTFTLPATLRRGDLTLAVATEGLCPALAGVLREELEQRYGPEYEELVALFGRLRKQMIAQGWEGRRIREAVAELYRSGIAGLIASGDRSQIEEWIRARLGAGF